MVFFLAERSPIVDVAQTLVCTETGLPRWDVKALFAGLVDEGRGLPLPSEGALDRVRTRLLHSIARSKHLTRHDKRNLRRQLASAYMHPIPEGATVYALDRIEARARQEVVLRSIGPLAHLDPPGPHADRYELGEDGRPVRVWYASYGSNLSRQRFLTYITGGRLPGGRRTYKGCSDKSAPEKEIAIRMPAARLYFTGFSSVWLGGVAFIDQQRHSTQATTLARAWLVSTAQFDQIVAQENGLDPDDAVRIPLHQVLAKRRWNTNLGIYSLVVHIGDYEGAPVVTFTASRFGRHASPRRRGRIAGHPLPAIATTPSAAYLRMIGAGLAETFGLAPEAQADYLRGCPGADQWERDELIAVLRGPVRPLRGFHPAGRWLPTVA